MPIGFRNFRSIPTKLKLNGPSLKFTQDPQDGAEGVDRIAVFTAKAIAEFPGASVNPDGGYSFSWYLGGNKLDPNNEFVKVESGFAESKLTLSNVGIEDNNKLVYCEVEYLPGPNEGVGHVTPFKSNTATLTAFPELEITKQPVNQSVGTDVFAKYSCDSQVLPSTQPQDQEYQWQFNGVDLVDGESSAEGSGPVETIMKVTSDEGDDFELNFENITSFSDWKTNRTYTLVCTGDLTANLYAIGGGGGGSGYRNVKGSAGGAAEGTFTFLRNQVYKLQIGAAGGDGDLYPIGSAIVPGGFPGGGDSPTNGSFFRSGGGGGYTGLFINSVAHENAILIGAGGGGSTGDPGQGGNGGGAIGTNQGGGGRQGQGGTQTAGGAGGTDGGAAESGSKLKGGKGFSGHVGSAGGGAGYYGGGGGGGAGPGTGGGGSAYFNPELITNGDYDRVGSNSPQLNYEADGSFKLVKISSKAPSTITVSGAKTKNLSIKTDADDFGADIRCKISSPSVQVSPLYTNSVNFQSFLPSPVLVLEAYDTVNKLYKRSETTLISSLSKNSRRPQLPSSVTLNSSTFGSQYNLIQFYSKEGNFNFNLNVKAAKGKNKGSFVGGEGGTSTIQINAKRQTEYTILGVSNNSAVFIYEKSRLIACVGQGGDAGTEGNGGNGGGVNVDGIPGFGRNPGLGGERPVTGTLGLNGSYGSVMSGATISLYDGDTIQSQQNGGQTLSCTKGSYYINQGLSPCEDVSSELIQFVDNSGSTYTDSDEIFRGFKPGYTITDTAGAGADDSSGKGGNGATGGDGGSNRSGGGGGAGYVDDSVVVIETSVGGNKDEVSEIVFSV